MKVLVAIDSSPLSDLIAKKVAERPWPDGTEMLVLNVVDSKSFSSGFADVEARVNTEAEAGRALVRSKAEQLAAHGLDVTCDVVEGHPRTSIVEYAAQWGADFIIIGSHGEGGIGQFFLGSVARSVLRSASCSVEIVRPENLYKRKVGKGIRILVATDGSECSRVAAESIAGRPWPKGSEVKAVSVAVTAVLAMEPWYGMSALIDRMQQEADRIAGEAIDSAEDLIARRGLQSIGVVLRGNPKARILEEAKAWGADLIVVGSHGKGRIDRMLLGSVSEAVAMHAHCSVDVIRERDRADEE